MPAAVSRSWTVRWWASSSGVGAGAGGWLPPLIALLGWLSGGPAGGARLTDVGPVPWLLGLVVGVEVAAGAVVAALLLTAVGRRTSP